MKSISNNISPPVKFNQVVKLVKQLPDKQKIKLGEVIRKETNRIKSSDTVVTHFASEKALAKEWLSKEEDDAWKDL